MSGGHFGDYIYYPTAQFADELEIEIKENFMEDEFGWCPKFGENTINYLKEQVKSIRKTAEIMNVIDYLYAGDYSEDYFMERISQIEEKYSEQL